MIKNIKIRYKNDVINKNVIDKGYAEIFYKMKSFVFFLE